MKPIFAFLFCTIFFISSAFSQISTTVIYDFGDPNSPICGDWVQNDIFYNGCANYYGYGESFLGSQLEFIYTGPGVVTNFEADMVDYCGFGCTSAAIYSGPNLIQSIPNSVIGQYETYTFSNLNFLDIDKMTVMSFEGFIREVRITIEEEEIEEIPEVLTVDENIILSGLYQACDTIFSKAVISDASNVEYVSGNIICLESGFTVDMGSEFSAEIDGVCIEPRNLNDQ